jgi:hypothetical protein
MSDPRYSEIAELARDLNDDTEFDEANLSKLKQIDEIVFQLFGISAEEQVVVKKFSEIGPQA